MALPDCPTAPTLPRCVLSSPSAPTPGCPPGMRLPCLAKRPYNLGLPVIGLGLRLPALPGGASSLTRGPELVWPAPGWVPCVSVTVLVGPLVPESPGDVVSVPV